MSILDASRLSIAEKIGQLFFIGIPGSELDNETEALLNEIQPGGVCLFARNIKEARQTRDLLDGIRGTLTVETFLSIDQEGGRVDRLRRILTPMPAAGQLRTAEDAAELGSIIGEALSLLGFNMDFAPVVDVIGGGRADLVNGLQTRGLGNSKEDVVWMASEFLDALKENGVLGCLKHFPGLAASTVDSHEELPVVTVSGDELRSNDLFPYRSLLGKDDLAIMVAHAAYPNTDLQEFTADGKLLPSSLSDRVVNELLRNDLGFDGVAITDDLEMGAIVKNFGIGEACKAAIKAGEDMLAICASTEAIREGHKAVADSVASGEISEGRIDESIARIFALKSRINGPSDFDVDRLGKIDDRIKNLNQHIN